MVKVSTSTAGRTSRLHALTRCPESGALAGKGMKLRGSKAIVIEGQHRLGATVADALGMRGCTVLLNQHAVTAKGVPSARSSGDRFSPVEVRNGNAANGPWCHEMRRRLVREGAGLDLLVCNLPPVSLLIERLSDTSCGEVVSHVDRCVGVVAGVFGTFLDLLAARHGWVVMFSSDHARSFPQECPHGVAGAWAAEGLFSWAARQNREVNFLLVRPPAALPEGTVPINRNAAFSSESIAEAVVHRLTRSQGDRQAVECLENFEISTPAPAPDVTYQSLLRHRWYIG